MRDGRLHDKRGYSFPACTVVSVHKRRALFCKESAYDFRLLGICTDVRSSGVSLEYDAGNGKEIFPETVCGTEECRAKNHWQKKVFVKYNKTYTLYLAGKIQYDREGNAVDMWPRCDD